MWPIELKDGPDLQRVGQFREGGPEKIVQLDGHGRHDRQTILDFAGSD
jgi:hypothetical protein